MCALARSVPTKKVIPQFGDLIHTQMIVPLVTVFLVYIESFFFFNCFHFSFRVFDTIYINSCSPLRNYRI